MKKFLVIASAIASFVAWSDTASAQCNGRRCNGNGRVAYSTPVYFPSTYSTCSGPGCLGGQSVQSVQSIPQQSIQQSIPQTVPFNEGNKSILPPQYKGDAPLPPKEVRPPNPLQEGYPAIMINGESYKQLADGTYANVSDGTYSRLMGTTAYGSYSK